MEQIKLPTGEKMFQEQLDNGLKVFILPKPILEDLRRPVY